MEPAGESIALPVLERRPPTRRIVRWIWRGGVYGLGATVSIAGLFILVSGVFSLFMDTENGLYPPYRYFGLAINDGALRIIIITDTEAHYAVPDEWQYDGPKAWRYANPWMPIDIDSRRRLDRWHLVMYMPWWSAISAGVLLVAGGVTLVFVTD